MANKKNRYWIGVVSKSHVERGVNGGFAQLCHGKAQPLKRMTTGDWLIYYSPKTDMTDGDSLQAFTAIGKITGESAYEFQMTPDFIPYRRNVSYLKCTVTPIQPLLPELSFIKDPTRWGYPFRRGHFEITESDFKRIACAMGVSSDEQK